MWMQTKEMFVNNEERVTDLEKNNAILRRALVLSKGRAFESKVATNHLSRSFRMNSNKSYKICHTITEQLTVFPKNDLTCMEGTVWHRCFWYCEKGFLE